MERYPPRHELLKFPWNMSAALVSAVDMYNHQLAHTSTNMPPATVMFGNEEIIQRAQLKQQSRWSTRDAMATTGQILLLIRATWHTHNDQVLLWRPTKTSTANIRARTHTRVRLLSEHFELSNSLLRIELL